MSALENELKPFILSIIKGEIILLPAEAQSKIASWIIMKTIVQECFDNAEDPVAPFDVRDKFRGDRIIPDKWQVWIGRISAQFWECSCFHVDYRGVPVPGDPNQEGFRATAYLYTIGCALLYVVGNSSYDDGVEFSNPYNLLRQLHPNGGGKLLWPALDLVTQRMYFEYITRMRSDAE